LPVLIEVLRFRGSHASQGKTVDQVIVSVPVAAFSQTNEAQFQANLAVSEKPSASPRIFWRKTALSR